MGENAETTWKNAENCETDEAICTSPNTDCGANAENCRNVSTSERSGMRPRSDAEPVRQTGDGVEHGAGIGGGARPVLVLWPVFAGAHRNADHPGGAGAGHV